MTLLTLFAAPALAGTIDAWSAQDFSRDGGEAAGSDGWENGYPNDTWFGYRLDDGNNWVSPYLDYGDNGRFGDGGAHDNYLVNEAVDVEQGVFNFSAYVTDNDAWGIVFGRDSSKHYFLVLVCGVDGGSSKSDCPSDAVGLPGSGILEISGGDVTVLATSKKTLAEGDYGDGSVSINDGEITFAWGAIEMTATAPDGLFLNGVGFYGYNEGWYGEDGQADGDSAWFTGPELLYYDDDDDGVADDADNCEKDANADQADADGDGIGTVCDDDESGENPGDSGTTDSGGTDSGNGNGNGNGAGDDPTGGDPGGLTAPGECSCSVTDPTAAVGLLAALAAFGTRRRRTG